MVNKIGIIEKLLTGEYQSPFSRKNIKLPIDEIVITSSILNYQFRHFENVKISKNRNVRNCRKTKIENSKTSKCQKLRKRFFRNFENYKQKSKFRNV